MRQTLRTILIEHEGKKSHVYKDTLGNLTIGIGRNLSGTNLYDNEIELMFENDTDWLYNQFMTTFDWFVDICEPRQIALIDMAFMGWKNFLEFKNMLAAFAKGDYTTASAEILNSSYAKQVGQRAKDIARIIRMGVI